jgi:hypothetical protein
MRIGEEKRHTKLRLMLLPTSSALGSCSTGTEPAGDPGQDYRAVSDADNKMWIHLAVLLSVLEELPSPRVRDSRRIAWKRERQSR